MQLLLQDLRTEEHDKLWKQLDAEIHLHRHKTVVRACRSRLTHAHTQQHQASSLFVFVYFCVSFCQWFQIHFYLNNINNLEHYPQSQAVQSSDDIDGAATTTTTTAASNGLIAAASPNRHQRRRIVTLQKPPHEGLGMSITVSFMMVILWGLWMWWLGNSKDLWWLGVWWSNGYVGDLW